MKLLISLNLFILLTFIPAAQADTLKLAVATNFKNVLDNLIPQFEQKHDIKITVSYGSSGKLFAQIVRGAPYDLFMSADRLRPIRLIEANKAIKKSLYVYASGKLVIWSFSKVDDPLKHLQSGLIKKLAIANSRLAPYGIAAEQVLNYNSIDKGSIQLIKGENIGQTYQYVYTGNAPYGLVALSQVLSSNSKELGTYEIIPTSWYKPIEQALVALGRGSMSKSQTKFVQFVKSQKTRALIRSMGYE